ncbi:MAG: orotidine-5'-phosphate decarboxylase [Oscillospiraceae bacterium]|nr:orotidine-5'-phosphate decarboxylase [Oscillospiraceae bacterium]
MSIDVLQEKICKRKNPTVAGLDPKPEYIPPHILARCYAQYGKTPKAMAAAYEEFCKGLIDALAPIVPAVKPQAAYFEVLGHDGMAALENIVAYAKQKNLYVIMDCKRGDIGTTAEAYAAAYLGSVDIDGTSYAPYDADSVTVNGYLGTDGIKPFTQLCKQRDKSIFLLVKTSNKSSMEVQDLVAGDRLMYRVLADLAVRLSTDLIGQNGYSNVAAVIGATHPQVLETMRAKYPQMFFLVPGYGAQGGTAKDVQYAFDRLGRGAIVNASRSIMCAWQKAGTDGTDYGARAAEAAVKMKNDIGLYVRIL